MALPEIVPVQVAGMLAPDTPVYWNELPLIEPLVEGAPESQDSEVLAHPLCAIVHSSSPHDPVITQVPASPAHAGGASPVEDGLGIGLLLHAHANRMANKRGVIVAPEGTAPSRESQLRRRRATTGSAKYR